MVIPKKGDAPATDAATAHVYGLIRGDGMKSERA